MYDCIDGWIPSIQLLLLLTTPVIIAYNTMLAVTRLELINILPELSLKNQKITAISFYKILPG